MAKKKDPTAEAQVNIKECKQRLRKFTDRILNALAVLDPGKLSYKDYGPNDEPVSKTNPMAYRTFYVNDRPMASFWLQTGLVRAEDVLGNTPGCNLYANDPCGAVAAVACSRFYIKDKLTVVLVDDGEGADALLRGTVAYAIDRGYGGYNVDYNKWIMYSSASLFCVSSEGGAKHRTLIRDLERVGRKYSPYTWGVAAASEMTDMVPINFLEGGYVFAVRVGTITDVAVVVATAHAMGAKCKALAPRGDAKVITAAVARGFKIPVYPIGVPHLVNEVRKQISKALRLPKIK